MIDNILKLIGSELYGERIVLQKICYLKRRGKKQSWCSMAASSLPRPSSLGKPWPRLKVFADRRLHAQPVGWCQVHLEAWWHAELQLMQQDG